MSNSVSSNEKSKKQYSFLAQWRIENFKSIKSAKIDLAPLSVLVGPNSAGKSSLIQSILLFAQNCSRHGREFDGNLRGQLILNGDLVNLGTLEEAHCDYPESINLPVKFGATYNLGPNRRGAFFIRQSSQLNLSESSDSKTVLDWDLSLMNEPETINSGTAVVNNIDITLAIGKDRLEKMYVDFTNGSHIPAELVNDRPDYTEKYLAKVEFKKSNSEKNSNLPVEIIPDLEYSAISLNAGLPTDGLRLITQLDRQLEVQKKIFSTYGFLINELLIDTVREAQKGNLLDKLKAIDSCRNLFFEKLENVKEGESRSNLSRIRRTSLFIQESPLINLYQIRWESVQKFLDKNPMFVEMVLNERTSSDKIDDLIEKFSTNLDDEIHNEMVSFWDKVSEKIKSDSRYQTSSKQLSWAVDRERTRYSLFDPEVFSANESWSDQLARGVLYLEPLREAPKANYTYSAGGAISPQIPLGSKGEHLAQRLYDRRLAIFPLPGELDNKTKMPLIDAVNAWLKFLNIEGPIKVVPQGRSGFQLTVGGKVLPMLGTGISQVLPVLTLCLIARRGDLILLEQPELHLNPSLQQTLADFLLAMSKTHRQIIVETHSEYLVTRLRLNSLIDNDSSQAKIFFVEKESSTGTQYREIQSNEFGEITDWPKGFFDQASSDYKRLILKIAEKKEQDLQN